MEAKGGGKIMCIFEYSKEFIEKKNDIYEFIKIHDSLIKLNDNNEVEDLLNKLYSLYVKSILR